MNLSLLRLSLESSDIVLRLELSLAVLCICLLVFYIFQKLLPNFLFGEDAQYAGYIYNAMGVVFSIMFAFITVLVWQSYNDVDDAITKEANNLNSIYRLFSAFPPELERNGKDALKGYTKTVIEEEWPLLRKDQFSMEAYKQFLILENMIIRIQPQNLGQANAHRQILQLMTDAAELRRSRIYNAKFALAPPAWIGLISSSMIFLVFSCLFKMQSKQTHLILILFLGLTIVGVLYFLVLFIHPFLGPMAIGPDAFANLLKLNWAY
jgi:hypothetical protein